MKARSPLKTAHLARLQGFAHAMRTGPTQSERLLWAELSCRKLGVAFRRQVVVEGHIVDFLAPARKLIVEVDGGYHAEDRHRRSDCRRDKRLAAAGFRVLRLPAQLVVHHLAVAVQRVRAALG